MQPFNDYISKSSIYKENNDLDNALKYALLASSCTFTPRADVCCLIGEIYLQKGNLKMSISWFNIAYENNSYGIDEVEVECEYYTTTPLKKLVYLYYKTGNVKMADETNNSLLLLTPEDETALQNKKLFMEQLQNC